MTALDCEDTRLGRSMRDVDVGVDAIARVGCGRKRAAVLESCVAG